MELMYVMVLIPLILLTYFELLGRWVCYKLNTKIFCFYFPIGFLSSQALVYITSILTNTNVSFYILLLIYILLFIISIILIIKDYKKLKISFNKYHLLLMIIITIILCLYSINTSFGNLHGFDTLHYLNMATQNIGLESVNSKDIYLNGPVEYNMVYYTNETYYYFVGCVLYIFEKIAHILSIGFNYMSAFSWSFQILFNMILSSIIIEIINKFKHNKIAISIVIPILFVFGRLYYNNIFGFFGNSLYNVSLSIVSILLINYFEKENRNIRILIYLCGFGICSLTSSGIYTLLFILVALYFISEDKDYLLFEYGFIIIIPIYNAFRMERMPFFLVYIFPMLLGLFLIIFGKKITRFITKNKLLPYLLVLCFLITFSLSRLCSKNLFDFTGLLNNNSQRADMTLNYFSFESDYTIVSIYKILSLTLLFVSLTFNYKNKYVSFVWILIIIFFNPFSCNFINKYINVYYRAYSIFLNPFSLAYFLNILYNKINIKYIKFAISLSIAIPFIISYSIFKPMYYNSEFKTPDDYNFLYRMRNDEYDIIKELKNNIYYYKEKQPYIITDNFLTQSIIPEGRYFFGRGKTISIKASNAEKKLYEIFYPPDYLGDVVTKYPDYNNMINYIKEAKVNYIVVNKKVEVYDSSQNIYYSLDLMVNDKCSIYPIYENKSYALYHFTYY